MVNYSVAITGGSSGIGKALALHYASQGCSIYLAARDTKKLSEIKRECGLLGVQAHVRSVDVKSLGAMKHWLDEITLLQPLDLLFVNAGVTNGVTEGNRIEALDDIRDVLETNLLGAIYCVSLATNLFLKQKKGHVVVLSSLAGYVGFAGAPAYCASKGGLRLYCEGMQRNLKGTNINLTLIYPGYVKTPMSDRVVSPKPFSVTAELAAKKISDAVLAGKKQYGFPTILWWGVRLLAVLPLPLQRLLSPFFDFDVAKKNS